MSLATHPILAGLLSALCWGVSDWLARGSSRALGPLRAQLWSGLAGFAVLSVAVVLSGEGAAALQVQTPRVWLWALFYAVCVGAASLAFFDAFGRGKLALVAPIVGSYGAVGVALSLVTGVHIHPVTGAGLALIIGGVVVASVSREAPGSTSLPSKGFAPGVLSAIVAALLFGTAFFVLGKEVAAPLGGLVPVWMSRLIGPAFFLAVAPRLRMSLAPPGAKAWRATAGSGILASAAAVATGYGSMGNDDAVVAVLGSMSVVVTVLISLVMLRERLFLVQWVGVVLTLLGIPLLAWSPA